MTLIPWNLANDLDQLEAIEKASLRHVVQAVLDFRGEAESMFANESDLQADIGEDITREALDRMGTSIISQRLFGKIDYKRARYLFDKEFSLRQALLVDSKAEKSGGSARIQVGQTSLEIRQTIAGVPVIVPGTLPKVLTAGGLEFLTTTIFVKYLYKDLPDGQGQLKRTTIIALPNGMLQDRYNPNTADTIWNVGPNSTARGEAFRTRIAIGKLKAKANWRVQNIPSLPAPFEWDN